MVLALSMTYVVGVVPAYLLGRYWFPAIWRSLMLGCALVWPIIVWMLFASFVFDVMGRVLK